MKTYSFRSIVFAALALAAPAANAQTSPWYITEGRGDVGNTHIMQGGSPIGSYGWATSAETAIYVDYGSSTVSQMSFFGSNGSLYNLSGGYLGALTTSGSGAGDEYDGGWDGANSYTVGYGSGNVRAYGPNFSGSGSTLFNVYSSVSTQLGVTYDTGAGHIWTSDWGGGQVHEWTTGGALLQSIAIPGSSTLGSLAYDAADDTFWVANTSVSQGVQFDRKGNILSTITLPAYTLGGEIGAIPAPSSFALLGLGGLAAARRRRA